ncbi:hypothetical protein [Frigoriglobus tundricola]|uniref:Uncharacterized protein n=1 Tax=Frigoriglobus tundricola TaxID=2774151 RepID=A0A6M5YLL3_9BACT|nr:hypothetical protein [Frigoriglobus tundricola]QJW94474.1 hypothetical protein FTUN_1994 [Frigoriglobus tundricola]
MPVWKTLLICVLACACMALALSTVLVTISHEGRDRWMWAGGLLTATVCVVALFTLFLRHASDAMNVKSRGRTT